MEALPKETVRHVALLCAMWGAISGSFHILQICIPLITKDVSKDGAAQWLGTFMSINAICGAIFSVAGGFLSEFVGRMTLMQPWTLYFFLSVLAVMAADAFSNVYLLLFARTAALAIPTTILLAYLSDFLLDAALVESHAYLSGSFGVMDLTATLLCGLLNQLYSRTASLLLALTMSSIALYIVFRSSPPPPVKEALAERAAKTRLRGKDAASCEGFYRSLRLLVAHRYLLLISMACSTVRLANMNNHLMLVYFISYRTSAGLSSISYVLGLMAFTMSVSQLVALPMAVRHRCVYPALLVSLLLMSLCVMCMAFCFTLTHFAISCFFLGCILIAPSTLNARISALSSPIGISGVTLGAVSTVTNTAEVLVAVLYGNLLQWTTHTYGAQSSWSGIPFFINGLTVFVAVLLVLFAEWRYGRKLGPWGTGNKRQAEALVESVEDQAADVEEAEGMKGRFGKEEDVVAFATQRTIAAPSHVAPGVIAIHVEKCE